jgi:hypothetical protein
VRLGWSRVALSTFLFAAFVLAGAGLAGGSEPRDVYETAIASDSPVAQYRFEDASESTTLADSAGSNAATDHDIALGGGGPFNGSASGTFDGEAYASLSSDPLEGATEFTVETWVYWDGGSSYDEPIFDFGSSATNHVYLTPADNASGHGLSLELHASEGASAQVSAPRLGEGAWHYVAVSENSTGALKVYVDGTEVGHTDEVEVSPATLGSAPTAYLGKSLATASGFEGRLSNLAFYTKALSASTIKAHYDAGEFPVNAEGPTIAGTAQDGSTLTAEAGSWTGLEPITFGYQWRRCDGSGERCSDISGATGSTYDASSEDVGHRLRVLLTATNGAGSGEALSSMSAFVEPSPLSEFGYVSEFGSEGSGDGQFSDPVAVAVSASGDSFVLDRGNDRIEKFNEAGEYLGQFGEEGTGDGQLQGPSALAVDSKGDVFVLDTGNERIDEFDEHGEFLQTIGAGAIGYAEGLAVDRHDRVWVSATSEKKLIVFDEEGEHLKDVGSPGSAPGQFGEPEGLAVDDAGHVWVADYTGRVEEFDEETGAYVSQFGSSGGGAGQLSGAYGVVLDEGHLFVSEWGNNRVQEFDEEGGFIAQLGVPGEEAGDLGFPVGLAVDQAHDLLIVDAANSRVQRWGAEAPGTPANLAPPSISGAPGVGLTVAVSAGVWSGSPRRSYTYQWRRCDEHGEECADIAGATGSAYSPLGTDFGSTLRVVVTATNSHGAASSTTAASELIGLPPINTSPPTISGTTEEGEELTADPGAWEGASGTSVQWERCDEDGEECSSLEAWEENYTVTAADIGHTLRVIAYAWNSAGEVTAVSTPTAVVTEPAPPEDLSAPTIAGIARQEETLTASHGGWGGTPPISYAYQWQRCDESGEGCADIEGATGASYEAASGDVGATLRVHVTASNASGSSDTGSAPTSVVAPPASPTNLAPPTISGTLEQDETLTASDGEWEGTKPFYYAYQWQRCDAVGSECGDVEGATGSEYELSSDDVGSTLRVLVTASNFVGSASATSAATGVAAARIPPGNLSAPGIIGSARDGETVTADPGSWEGSPAPTYRYQWQSCEAMGDGCSDIDGANSASYTVESADIEGTLRVLVTAENIAGSAEAASAPSEDVEPGPPSELQAPAIEGSSQVGQALVADPGEWGGTETELTYQWQLCESDGSGCSDIASATDAEYALTSAELGHALRLEIGASNDLGAVLAISVATTAVDGESALFNTWSPAIAGTPQLGQVLTASAGSWIGLEALGYAYQWQRCDEAGEGCIDIEGATEATYEAASGDVGHVLRVLASASEEHGAMASASAASAPIAAANAPVSTVAPEIVGSPLVGETLSSNDGEWSGGTGALSYAYQWQRCDQHGGECAPISGATSVEYFPSGVDAGSTLRVLLTATDADGHSSSATSDALLLSASTLQAVSAPSLSGPGQVGRALSASSGIWTGAGAIEFSYQWQRCDEEGESCTDLEGATEAEYVPSETDAGHALRLRVDATNGSEAKSATSPATPAVAAGPIAPEDEIAPSIEGDTSVGDVLTAQTGKWLSSEAIEYAYQWERCDEEGEGCTSIEGASEATYTSSEEDAGSTLRVLVTASNAIGTAEAHSDMTEVVSTPTPPVNTEAPTILGTAVEGSHLAIDNGTWSGSRPLRFQYQWQRCDAEGESCTDIESATGPTYTPPSGDVGSRLRVILTASNALGTASVASAPTEAVLAHESASATHAIELAEEVDPSALAKAEPASIEEQTVTPAVSDAGEELHATSTLTSAMVSKDTPGELALSTAGGEISLAPLGTAPDANAMPTVANETAAVLAGTFPATDTIVRPQALGATTLLQLRSAQAPTSFSWEVGLGVDQELEELPDGSVAVVEAPTTSLEGPIPTEVELAPETEPSETEEEGYAETGAEEELEGAIAEEGPLEKLSAAPQVTTPSFTPKSTEPHPQDTAAQSERDSSAVSYAEAHVAGTVLMVIEAPSVIDAEGNSVLGHLSVDDATVTLSIAPEGEPTYPLIATESLAAPSDQATAAKAHAVRYGLSDPNPPVFESLDPKLKSGPGKLHVGLARDVIAYNTAEHPAKVKALLEWLEGVGQAGLRPYLTLGTLGSTKHEFCKEGESCPAPSAAHYKGALIALIDKLDAERTAETKHNSEVKSKKEGAEVPVIPSVQLWGAWNEPDLNLNNKVRRDPLYNKAPLAAQYWEIAQSVIHCKPCRVVAGEFAEDSDKDHVKYIENYLTHILHDHYHHAGKPRNIALHDYRDLVHVPESLSGYSNPAARRFVQIAKKRFGGHAHILFSEQGVELEAPSGLTRLAKEKKNAKHRQLLAAEDFAKLGDVSRNVDLVDYYLYRGPTTAPEFDSALLSGKASAPADRRPAYCYLVLNKHGCPAKAATNGSVSDQTTASTSAVLATVDPNGLPTKYRVEWGTTPAYGNTTSMTEASQIEGAQAETISLSGLRACTTYHYQAVAENEANEDTPSLGGDQTLTTGCLSGTPPTISLVPSTVPEGATFAGEPETIVKVSANGLTTYVEQFESFGKAGPPSYPAAWETTLASSTTLEQVGVVGPQCVSPRSGVVEAEKFVATNAAGSVDSGWIETHSVHCGPE